MTPDNQTKIESQIDRAHELAGQGSQRAAALAFATAREMTVAMADSSELDARVERFTTPLRGEREKYRKIVGDASSGDRSLVILGDSLGLPRPDDTEGAFLGAERTYAMLVRERLPEYKVDSYCQRFFTTRSVVELLEHDPRLGVGADVVVHVGLNDCATRMFLERERLALDLLQIEVKEKIVGFAQQHRRVLLKHLPAAHYVPPEQFRSNLKMISHLLQARNAASVIFATVILPETKFWPGTPGVQANFGAYNLMIMQAALEQDARLLDIDRHIWSRHAEDPMLADAMHLAELGHNIFADQIAALVS